MEQWQGLVTKSFTDLCNKYSLTPKLVIQITYLKIKGVNNSAVASMLGVHRVTVQRYLEVMGKMNKQEIMKIIESVLKSERGTK